MSFLAKKLVPRDPDQEHVVEVVFSSEVVFNDEGDVLDIVDHVEVEIDQARVHTLVADDDGGEFWLRDCHCFVTIRFVGEKSYLFITPEERTT